MVLGFGLKASGVTIHSQKCCLLSSLYTYISCHMYGIAYPPKPQKLVQAHKVLSQIWHCGRGQQDPSACSWAANVCDAKGIGTHFRIHAPRRTLFLDASIIHPIMISSLECQNFHPTTTAYGTRKYYARRRNWFLEVRAAQSFYDRHI